MGALLGIIISRSNTSGWSKRFENKFIIKGNADDAVGINQEAIQF